MIQLIGIAGLPEIRVGDDLAARAMEAMRRQQVTLERGDVVVVTSKVVSKAEGRVVALDEVEPSALARSWAAEHGKDARQVEVVLRETRRIVRMDRGVLIAETHHGFICANAGVDASNAATNGQLILLPEDPDASAERLRAGLARAGGLPATALAVVISDTFGRPWRLGQTNVAIGSAGIDPIRTYSGQVDPAGYELRVTAIAVVDELAAAAELVMGKLDRVPLAIVRGYSYPPVEEGAANPGAAALVRGAATDLFR